MMVFSAKKLLLDREIAGLQFSIFKDQSNTQIVEVTDRLCSTKNVDDIGTINKNIIMIPKTKVNVNSQSQKKYFVRFSANEVSASNTDFLYNHGVMPDLNFGYPEQRKFSEFSTAGTLTTTVSESEPSPGKVKYRFFPDDKGEPVDVTLSLDPDVKADNNRVTSTGKYTHKT